jgi:hypothetical protein
MSVEASRELGGLASLTREGLSSHPHKPIYTHAASSLCGVVMHRESSDAFFRNHNAALPGIEFSGPPCTSILGNGTGAEASGDAKGGVSRAGGVVERGVGPGTPLSNWVERNKRKKRKKQATARMVAFRQEKEATAAAEREAAANADNATARLSESHGTASVPPVFEAVNDSGELCSSEVDSCPNRR